jgi:hypothetical protein
VYTVSTKQGHIVVFLSVPRHEASIEFSLRVNKRGGAASLAPALLAVASILSDSLNLSDSHSTLTSLHSIPQ